MPQHNTDRVLEGGTEEGCGECAGGGLQSVERMRKAARSENAQGVPRRAAEPERQQLGEDLGGLEAEDLTFHIGWSEWVSKRFSRFCIRIISQPLIRVKRF